MPLWALGSALRRQNIVSLASINFYSHLFLIEAPAASYVEHVPRAATVILMEFEIRWRKTGHWEEMAKFRSTVAVVGSIQFSEEQRLWRANID